MRARRIIAASMISAVLLALSPPARADVIYLCADAPPVLVVPSRGASADAAAHPCVADWQVARQREVAADIERARKLAANGFTTGTISRDFCVEREACWLPQPRWRKRWDYESTHRHSIVIMRHR